MKIKTRKIKDLISAEYNPRQITEEEQLELISSIKRFGVVEPIIININKERKNIIISGHQRLKACMTLNMKEVPVNELDLTLEQEKELNLRMNKNGGKFDYELLTDYFDKDMLLDVGFKEFEFTDKDVNIDDIFDDVDDYEPTSSKNKIVLEYTDEEHQKVLDKLSEMNGTKEEIIFRLLKL